MAVKGNDSSEKTVLSKTLYTGLVNNKVVFVNPSKDQLETIGKTFQKEPQYVTEKEGKKRLRLDFWVTPQISTADGVAVNDTPVYEKFSLWMEPEIFMSKGGKTQFINKYGKTGWGMTATECQEHFLSDGARPAYKGEEDLHKFLAAFLNTKYNTRTKEYNECQLENPQALFDGNFTELTSILKSYKDNTVRLLYGVDDNGYQVIYNKYFEKTCINPNYKGWQDILSDDYVGNQFKADFQGELVFQPYLKASGKVVQPTADEEATKDVF